MKAVPGALADGWTPKREGSGFVLWLLALSWAPAIGVPQLVAYVGVPASVVALILLRRCRLSLATVIYFLALGTVAAASLTLEGDAARPLNAGLALLTYGSLLVLVPRFRYDATRYRTFVVAAAWIAILQVGVAAAQFLVANPSPTFQSMASGDAAVGTLLTNSHLFSVKMLGLLVVLSVAALVNVRRWMALAGAGAALLGVVLSSALLSTALGAVAIAAAIYLTPTTLILRRLARHVRRLRWTIAAVFLVGGLLFVATQPSNVRYMTNTLRSLTGVLTGESARTLPGKIAATIDSTDLLLSQTKLALIGTGPGHYSSRAALILSGGYLSPHPSIVPVSLSPYTETRILPRWNPEVWSVRFQDGVMNQPFHSIQSVLLELGLVGVLIGMLGYLHAWYRVLRLPSDDRSMAAIQLTAVLTLVLLPLLLLSDNWLEYPQSATQLLLPLVLAMNARSRQLDGPYP